MVISRYINSDSQICSKCWSSLMEDANNSMSSRYRIINILQLYWHSLAKLSILIANRYGDSTEPCLTPKSTLNISDQSPLQILSFQQVNFFLRSPRSSLTNGRRYGTVVRVINFILFTLQLALWRIARMCHATILYLSTDSALVILD